jgi:hypothetical protein
MILLNHRSHTIVSPLYYGSYAARFVFWSSSRVHQFVITYLPTSPALTWPLLYRSDGTDAAVFSITGASTTTIGEPTRSFDIVSSAGATPPLGAHRTATPPGRRRTGVAGTCCGGEAKEEGAAPVAAASDGCSILPTEADAEAAIRFCAGSCYRRCSGNLGSVLLRLLRRLLLHPLADFVGVVVGWEC